MEERNYKIYLLLFPGGEVYIGKTFKELYERWRNGDHYLETVAVGEAILYYGWENVQKIVLYENLTEDEANKMESLEIAKYGGINHPLVLNEQSGGDRGFYLSENTKNKMRETAKQMYIDHPELWDPVREARMVKVDQYSYDYSTLINTFDSVTEASKATGANRLHISSCLTGKRLSSGGFRWIQHGKHFGIKQFANDIRVKVDQLDKDTEKIICTYESIDAADRATHAGHSHISDCLKGTRKTAGGFKWRKSTLIEEQ